MKTAFVLLCLVLVAAASAEKRNILDDIAAEAGKLVKCETLFQQAACNQCCDSTDWFHPSEKNVCHQACTLLP